MIHDDEKENKKIIGGTQLMLLQLQNKLNTKLLKEFEIITTTMIEFDSTKKYILYCHDNITDQIYSKLEEENGYKQFEKIVFVSNWQMNLFIDYYKIPKEKCVLIRNSIKPIELIEKEKIDLEKNNKLNLIYTSTPNRGLDITYEVINKLIPLINELGYEIHLNVFSSFKLYDREDLDSYYQQLFTKIKNHPNMTYHSSVPNKVIRENLQKSHIFVYPSTYQETSCLCLIEAMSAGCICIHSSLGALPETCNNLTNMYPYHNNLHDHMTNFAKMILYTIKTINSNELKDKIIKQKEYVDKLNNSNKFILQWEKLFISLQNNNHNSEKIVVSKNMKIPKIIIQTWKNENIPKHAINLINNLKSYNPDFKYYFFSDEDINIFLEKEYPEYIETFNNFEYKIQKIDFFRLVAVYHYGGFYFDIDVNITSSIHELCNFSCVFPQEYKINGDYYLRKKNMNMLIGNYGFGACPKNNFIKMCIDNIIKPKISIDDIPFKGCNKQIKVFYTTGPVLISDCYIDYDNKEEIKIITSDNDKPYQFGNFGEHLMYGTWKN